MQVGELVAARFAIEAGVGTGGMGVVVRARDAESGEVVALKLLKEASDPRFDREARILSELEHPGIVRYIAHGEHEGQLFLAMEWLDGEVLRDRLARQPLTLAETISLARRVAEALAVAHQHGVVHRDLKPSNLLLCGGDPDRVKILDFGVARKVMERGVTETGVAVGTPGYMAPEQASGARSIDGRTDLFALGCVLFRCLTGQEPFHGGDARLALLQVVLAEPPRARALRPDVPLELDELCAAMMRKSPAQRPRDAATVAMRLRWLGDPSRDGGAEPEPPPASPDAEPHIVSLLLGSGHRPVARAEATGSRPTEVLPKNPGDTQATDLQGIVAQHGGRLELLGDGSIAVTFARQEGESGPARAAACAFALARASGGMRLALASGPTGSADVAMGDLLERAAALLGRSQLRAEDAADPQSAASRIAILVDEASARALEGAFEVVRCEEDWVLAGERAAAQSSAGGNFEF